MSQARARDPRLAYDAVIVGAGPAGSAAAATLAEAGCRVLLLEKDRFPRQKVCGSFLAGDARSLLDRLGVAEAIAIHEPEKITQGSLHVPGAPALDFRLRSAAIGISRFLFDHLLARRARAAGAAVRFGARVVSADRDNGDFRLCLVAGGETEEVKAHVAIGAWGRWDALDRALDRGFVGGRRFFGWSGDFYGDSSRFAGRVCLYLFRGGYCGLSRIEGGTVNLAGVVSGEARAAAGSGWEAVLERARRGNRVLDRDLTGLQPGPRGFLGTGPVFFTSKPPIENGMLMVGDAAGVLDPFSGEGQSAALQSGILAAETAQAALDGRIPVARLEETYARAWRRRFARRFGWSGLFRRLMLSPGFASAAARLAGDKLIRLGMERLQDQSGDLAIE